MSLLLPAVVHNPTTGQAIPAPWGDAVNDAIAYETTTKPACQVGRSSMWTHTSSGNTQAIPFDQEEYDVGGCHSTVSNTTRIYAPDAGRYLMTFVAGWEGVPAGRRLWHFVKNGSVQLAQTELAMSSTGECSGDLAVVRRLAAGDYVEVLAFQDSGGNLQMYQGTWTPTFTFEWIAA